MEIDYVYFTIYDTRISSIGDDFIKQLKNIINKIHSIFREDCEKYIYDNNGIDISIKADKKPPCISGKHFHGGCLNDEYRILHLLLELNKIYPSLLIKIFDSDGDFLLIDSPFYTDKLHKSNEKYHTYIHNNKIIYLPDEMDKVANINSLLSAAAKNNQIYDELDHVTKRATNRINTLTSSLHSTSLYVPHIVAYFLQQYPFLISEIVHNFDNRYLYSINSINTRCDEYSDKLIKYRVLFNKSLFAKLFTTKYQPPKKSSWCRISNFNTLPLLLGYKITVGFIVLLESVKHKSHNIFGTSHWRKFHQNLCVNGYYQNEIEGSQKYTELRESAIEHFKKVSLSSDGESNDFDISSIISELLAKYTPESNVSSDILLPDDDLSWLETDINDVEAMLKRKYNEDVQIKFSDLKMDHFFNSKSDLKGVDFNDPFIDSDINLNPDSIDLYLKNALDDIQNYNESTSDASVEDSQLQNIDEMKKYMKELGSELAVDDSDISKNSTKHVDDLLRSFLNQETSAGPAFNLFSQIGYDPNFHIPDREKK